jgi:CrcB protein
MKWIAVFVGGGAGSVVRYALGLAATRVELSLPWATFLANLIAATFIGILASQQTKMNGLLWPLLATGFCGGLSTFSTFSHQTIELFQQGQITAAVVNIVLSVICCLGAVWLGMKYL